MPIRLSQKSQQRVRALVREGNIYKDVSKICAAEGILGIRDGRPIARSTISAIVNHRDQRKAAPRRKTSEPKPQGLRHLDAVKAVLRLNTCPEERIALALLILEK